MATAHDITLRAVDFPAYGKTHVVSLDARILEGEEAIEKYCRERFGPGSLSEADDGTWVYARRWIGPSMIWTLVTKLLNKSYS